MCSMSRGIVWAPWRLNRLWSHTHVSRKPPSWADRTRSKASRSSPTSSVAAPCPRAKRACSRRSCAVGSVSSWARSRSRTTSASPKRCRKPAPARSCAGCCAPSPGRGNHAGHLDAREPVHHRSAARQRVLGTGVSPRHPVSAAAQVTASQAARCGASHGAQIQPQIRPQVLPQVLPGPQAGPPQALKRGTELANISPKPSWATA